MIDGHSVLALVPARGGSKGFPGKNLAKLAGRSLVARAVDVAKSSAYVDRIIVSSDAQDILDEARAAGAEALVRPAEFAGDEATTAAVVTHALGNIEPVPDLLVLLQPTTPLRTTADIDQCLEACVARAAPACVSVVPVEKSPFLMFWREDGDALRPVIDAAVRPSRRQDMPAAYMLNGAVYVVRTGRFKADPVFVPAGTVSIVMSLERSIDIDEPRDLAAAERALGCPQ